MPKKNTGIGFINSFNDFENLTEALLNQLHALSANSQDRYTSFTDSDKSVFIAYINQITGRGRQERTIKDAYQVLFIVFYRYVVDVYREETNTVLSEAEAIKKTNTLVAKIATVGQYGNTGVVRRQTTPVKMQQLQRILIGADRRLDYYQFSNSAEVRMSIRESVFPNIASFEIYAIAFIKDKLRISSPSRRTSTTSRRTSTPTRRTSTPRRSSTPSTSTSTTSRPSSTTTAPTTTSRGRIIFDNALYTDTICVNPITSKAGIEPWAEKNPYERAMRLGALFLYVCNVFETYDRIDNVEINRTQRRPFHKALVDFVTISANRRGFNASEAEKFVITMMMLLSTGRINMAKKICKPFMRGKQVRDTNEALRFVFGDISLLSAEKLFKYFRKGMFYLRNMEPTRALAMEVYNVLERSNVMQESVNDTIDKIDTIVPTRPVLKNTLLSSNDGSRTGQLIDVVNQTFTGLEPASQFSFFFNTVTERGDTFVPSSSTSRTSQVTDNNSRSSIPPEASQSSTLVKETPFTGTVGIEIEYYGVSDRIIEEYGKRRGITIKREGYNHSTRPYWKIVYDSTQGTGGSGESGEIVSPVLKGKKGITEMRKCLMALNEAGMLVNKDGGLHVHFGVQGYSIQTIKNIIVNYYGFQKLINKMLNPYRRNNTWANEFNSRQIEKVKESQSMNDIMRAISGQNRTFDSSDARNSSRYHVINVFCYLKYGTLEFRQHAANIETDTTIYWVYFLHFLIEASKKKQLSNYTWKNLENILPKKIGTFWANRVYELSGGSEQVVSDWTERRRVTNV
jgi:hypothetical protein